MKSAETNFFADQGWEFALLLFALSLLSLFKKCKERESLLLLFTKRVTWTDRSCRYLQKERGVQIALVAIFKNGLDQNQRIALFTFSNTRAILSLWKSDSLFLRVGFAPFWRENWKQGLKN